MDCPSEMELLEQLRRATEEFAQIKQDLAQTKQEAEQSKQDLAQTKQELAQVKQKAAEELKATERSIKKMKYSQVAQHLLAEVNKREEAANQSVFQLAGDLPRQMSLAPANSASPG